MNGPGSKGTVLAFDFGLKRTGVAAGEWETRLAHPLETIVEETNEGRLARIAALLAEWHPVALVVGLPLALDGGEGELARRCRRFANQLAGRYGLPVDLVDERLTSVDAGERLSQAGLFGPGRKEALDSLAAQRILQDYFEQSCNCPNPMN